MGSVCNPLITVNSPSSMPCKIESSDKPEISQEGENIFCGKHLLTINADFALQLEITRNLNLISIYIQSVVTTCDLVESG